MKKYLKEVYFEGVLGDAVDTLVDLLYANDILEKAQQLREEFEKAKECDEAEFKREDIYVQAGQ